jgi:ADP-ribose pyrophosphatase YjhB (NUDIX family)
MVWTPRVTVAAVIEQQGRFLLVKEETPHGIRYNQPAGHLEENEDLLAAVKREVYEETAWQFEPEALISVHLWRHQPTSPTFLRFCFVGQCHSFNPHQALDTGIIACHWLSRDEIAARQTELRSPLVLACIDEYLSDQRYPLSMLQSLLASADG